MIIHAQTTGSPSLSVIYFIIQPPPISTSLTPLVFHPAPLVSTARRESRLEGGEGAILPQALHQATGLHQLRLPQVRRQGLARPRPATRGA